MEREHLSMFSNRICRRLPVFLALASGCAFGAAQEHPLVMLRFSSAQTCSPEEWKKTAKAFADNRGCCHDVWLSTGESFPSLDWHRRHMETVRLAARDLRAAGYSVSLQFEATIGHGDSFPTAEEKKRFDKPWTGWTGPDGTECVYCSCPRQPGFLRRLADVSALYAEIEPAVVWIDDDLRVENHSPVRGNDGPGCWCARCVADFAKAEGRNWTRETLHVAWKTDAALRDRWRAFCFGSLAEVAATITRAFRTVSPKTRVGLQTCVGHDRFFQAVPRAISAAMDGEKTCIRLGGGMYYDLSPYEQIDKSRQVAADRPRLGLEDVVDSWCTEVESYPRAYASRSVRSVALEAFSSLGWGCDTVSLFVMDRRSETDELYSRYLLKPLCAVTRFLSDYRDANRGTVPAGLTCPLEAGDDRYLMGLPILPGVGRSWGAISAEKQVFAHLGPVWGDFRTDRMTDFRKTPSARQQAIRDGLSGSAPLKVCSPFVGVVMPRVSADGAIRTVGLIGTRLDPQEVVLELSTPCRRAVWHELGVAPRELQIVIGCDGKRGQVTIPSIGAWGLGYLVLEGASEPVSADASRTFTLASWNIGHFALGRTHVPTLPAVEAEARGREYRKFLADVNADVIGVCEFSESFVTNGAVSAREAVFAGYDAAVVGPSHFYYWNAQFLRRGEILGTRVHEYAKYLSRVYYLETRLRICGEEVVFVETHLDWKDATVRAAQMRELVDRFRDVPRIVIAGDFNPGIRDPERPGAAVDNPAEYRVFADAGFTLGNDGRHKTCPPENPSMSLDNIIVKGLKLRNFKVWMRGDLSDHALVSAELEL